MNKTELKKCADKIFLNTITSKRNGQSFNYFDSRTKVVDEIPHVYPVGISDKQVYICCPYCHQFHVHGRKVGHRAAHCYLQGYENNGYFIESTVLDNTHDKNGLCGRGKRKRYQ